MGAILAGEGEARAIDKDRDLKWVRGIEWTQIDENNILRHTASRDERKLEIDLNRLPMVKAELGRILVRPKDGPVIVFEDSKLPYQGHQFRAKWRIVADRAGIPKTVKFMDSRTRKGTAIGITSDIETELNQ